MIEQSSFAVRHVSVVLVSAAQMDPQSIRPEMLSAAGIVPADWAPQDSINTPVLSRTVYQNGFAVQIEGNRCVFQEAVGGEIRHTYETHGLAKRYVDAMKLVGYTAVGLNWKLDLGLARREQ